MTRSEFVRQLEATNDKLGDQKEKAAIYNSISLFKLMTDEEWADAEQAACSVVVESQQAAI